MPSVNVVNGKQIVVERLDPPERVLRFLAKPFLQIWYHQDLIQAILRREPRDEQQQSEQRNERSASADDIGRQFPAQPDRS